MGIVIGRRCDPSQVTIGPFVAMVEFLLVLSFTSPSPNRDWLGRLLMHFSVSDWLLGKVGGDAEGVARWGGWRVWPASDA